MTNTSEETRFNLKMTESTSSDYTNLADYLAQLIKDKKQLGIFPNCFIHLERILDEEITRVRSNLFQLGDTKIEPLELPEGVGTVVSCSEKIYVPIKDFPEFNFVGRILGPRGMTAKQLEQETGCKIMVRGKGSMRDKKKEEQNRGKPNWEHLNDELHVLITVEDTDNRCKVKLQRAREEINKLLVPIAEGEDELKKRQLMELAIINGTYRDSKENGSGGSKVNSINSIISVNGMRSNGTQGGATGTSPGSLGAPLIIASHPSQHGQSQHHLHAAAALQAAARLQTLGPSFENLIYSPNPFLNDYYLSLADSQNGHALMEQTNNVGKMMNLRRLTSLRDHPYLTPTTTP